MSNIVIRPAGAADIAVITRIYADAVRHGTASFEIEPPDRIRTWVPASAPTPPAP